MDGTLLGRGIGGTPRSAFLNIWLLSSPVKLPSSRNPDDSNEFGPHTGMVPFGVGIALLVVSVTSRRPSITPSNELSSLASRKSLASGS